MTRCPSCGNTIPAGSATCPHCGHALASSPRSSTGGASAIALSSGSSGMPAPKQKSSGLALLLELLIPGSGAVYAGRVGVGVVWLLVSLIAVAIAVVIFTNTGLAGAHSNVLPSVTSSDTFPFFVLSDTSSLMPYGAIALAVALVWFAVRGMLATTYVRHFNTRQAHPATAAATRETGASAGQNVKTIVTVLIEMIPGGLGPWGVGDIVTAVEAAFGRTMDGLKLSGSERIIYLGASAIPLVPARPVIAVYRWLVSKNQ